MSYAWCNELKDEAFIEDACNHAWLCLGYRNQSEFQRLTDVLRRFSYRALQRVSAW